MTALPSPAGGAGPAETPLARGFATAGAALLVLVPIAMWLANRSAPLLLGLSAAAFTAAALVSASGGAAAARLRGMVASPLGLTISAFLIWALISILWSHQPLASLRDWAELALPIAFALAIAASGRFVPSPPLLRGLAMALILASVLCVIELMSGLSQRAALGVGKLMAFVFNRPAITALVLAVPVAHALWHVPGARRLDRALALLVIAAVAALALRSESASARLGLAVAILGWAMAALAPRLSRLLVGLMFVVTMALAPVLGPLAQHHMPPVLLKRLPPMTGQARIDIWESFGEAARARPWLGSGFGTSATLDRHPVAAQVSPEHRGLLAVGHPHDMPLQAWVETGFIGALLITLAGLFLLLHLGRLPARDAAPRLALFAACFAISVVGHGAWQGWWAAVIGASILWFPAGADRRQGVHHG